MTNDLTNADPFLQIIHVSDLHVVDPNFPHRDHIDLIDQIASLVPGGRDFWLDGAASHDPLAPAEFERFLKAITVNDPAWAGLETWLIDTGDLTTFSDGPSLNHGKSLLEHWSSVSGARLFRVHGNHDAWPEKFPLVASSSDVVSHRASLRRNHYTERWAEPPLTCAIPHSHASAKVMLFGLNSVLHERWRNTWARGEVKEDCYWEHARKPSNGEQIRRLASNITGDPGFRIVAIHHPVHYPNRPVGRMTIDNETHVAQELGRAANGCAPLAHLILSGHTHRFFPEHGTLPSLVRKCSHPRLGLDQFQLIVGSLMQLDLLNSRGDWPHQVSLLRFYAPRNGSQVLAIERLFAARNAGTGPYRFVPTDNGEVAQEIHAAY